MSADTIFVFATVAIAAVLFASNRIRLDIVAMLVVLALMLSRVLTAGEALSGFGDPVVLLVAGLLVVGEMLDRTGVAQSIGTWIIRAGRGSETRLLVLIMVAAAVLSSVMSSTAVVAIFIPIVFKVSSRTGINCSRLLLPMSYAAMISGMLTLIATTPNLVVSAELEGSGFQPLGFFSFFPIGLLVLIVAIIYILLVGRRMLAGGEDESRPSGMRSLQDIWDDFEVNDSLQWMRVSDQSPLVGKTIRESEAESRFDVQIVGADIPGRLGSLDWSSTSGPRDVLRPGRRLLVLGNPTDITRLQESQQLEAVTESERERNRILQEHGSAIALIHPDCLYIGKSLREVDFREKFGLHVIGIRRGKKLVYDYQDASLLAADTLLVAGTWKDIARLQEENHDFVLLEVPSEFEEARPAHRKAPIAVAILVAMVLLSMSGWVPVVTAVLMAAMAAIFSRCLTVEDAYRSISWSSLVLLAGMLPVADALDKTGGTAMMVEGVVSGVGSAGPYAMMTLLFFLTAGLSLFLSNTASAVLIAPVAIKAAEALEVSPYPFAIVVLIGASAAFASPVASPVVTLVVEPGRYRFIDFVKVGAPLMLLAYLVALLVTPLIFPL